MTCGKSTPPPAFYPKARHLVAPQHKKLLHGSTAPAIVIGLSLFWAWWDQSFYLGTFYAWNDSTALSLPSFLVGMAVSGIALVLIARNPGAFGKLAAKPQSAALCALAPVAGSALCILSAAEGLPGLAAIGSSANGLSIAILIALWFPVASERGASSSIIDMSLGIAGGVAIDAVMLAAMKPCAAAALSCILPLASLLIMRFAVGAHVDVREMGRRPAIKASTMGCGLKDEFFGLGLPLLVGIVIAEIGFNFMNYRFSFSLSASPDAIMGFTFLIARGLGALACFIAIGLFQVSPRRFFWVGTMLMSAAFALMPFFEVAGISPLVCNYVNMACFALVAIFEIAVFSEVADARRVNPLGPLCFGMVFLTGVTDLGMGLGALFDAMELSSGVQSAIMTAVGYAVVFGLFATVSMGQRYLDPSTGAASGRRIWTEQERRAEAARRKHYDELVSAAGLTSREREVLDLVLSDTTTRSMANSMALSENTVKTHVQSVYKKLGAHGRAEVHSLFAISTEAASIAPGSPEPHAEVQRPALDSVIGKLSLEFGLTSREQEIFALLARGYRNKEIQDRLVISPATVHSHTTSIYAKMNLHSRGDLADLVKQRRDASAKAD